MPKECVLNRVAEEIVTDGMVQGVIDGIHLADAASLD